MNTRFFALLLCLAIASCILADSSSHIPPVELAGKRFSAELKRQRLEDSLQQFQEKLQTVLEKTNREMDPQDYAGNARLKWINQVLEHPQQAVFRTANFSSEMYTLTKSDDLSALLRQIGTKLDAEAQQQTKSLTWQKKDPVEFVTDVLDATHEDLDLAFSKLSKGELYELRIGLYNITTANANEGYRFSNQQEGLKLVDFLKRVDRKYLLAAAQHLALLSDRGFLKYLSKWNLRSKTIYSKKQHCKIMIGSKGPNLYRLEQLEDVCAVIDPAGNDRYIEGVTSESRPLLVIIDLNGDDRYEGKEAGIQGGAILGASLLVDLRGNDRYSAADVSQGSALAGIGMLIDKDCDDHYLGDRRVQGQALGGIGILLDREGNDSYKGALFAQGVGATLGFGMIADLQGQDQYFAGGKYPDSYEDSPGFGSWSQGIGAGARGVADGGIGILLDGGGSDVYEADYFSQGGGYWFAVGIARDFNGDDFRLGATRTNFDGSPRTVPRLVRWGSGFGCHYAAGFLFDDRGDDIYRADWAGLGFGWDFGIGAISDFEGNDHYFTRKGVAQPRKDAVAILFDPSGLDYYNSEERKEVRNSLAFLLDQR